MIQVIDNKEHKFTNVDHLKDFLNSEGKAEFISTNFHDLSINQGGIRIGKKQYGLKECGLHSLCNRIKMPLDYAYRIPDDLFINSVNEIIKDSINNKVTINIQGNRIRAIHSDSYLPILNQDIINSISEVKSAEIKSAEIKRIYIGDEYMHLSLINPKKNVKVSVGDEISFGCSFDNSETGFRVFQVAEFIYRLVCSNGAVVTDSVSSVKRIHLGNGDDFNIRDYIESAKLFLEKGGDSYKNAFAKMKQKHYTDRELIKLGENIRTSLGKQNTSELVENWISKETSLYDIYNEITEVAHKRELPFAKQQNLERVAGKMVVPYRV